MEQWNNGLMQINPVGLAKSTWLVMMVIFVNFAKPAGLNHSTLPGLYRNVLHGFLRILCGAIDINPLPGI